MNHVDTSHPAWDISSIVHNEHDYASIKDLLGTDQYAPLCSIFLSEENRALKYGTLFKPSPEGWYAVYSTARDLTTTEGNFYYRQSPAWAWSVLSTFWSRDQLKVEIIFKGNVFTDANFSSHQFQKKVTFKDCIFEGDCDFTSAQFMLGVKFLDVVFKKGMLWYSATVDAEELIFENVTFGEITDNKADAEQPTSVVSFKTDNRLPEMPHSTFKNVKFYSDVTFDRITFNDEVVFDDVKFYRAAQFLTCHFKKASFSPVEFYQLCEFKDCEFKNTTAFTHATFAQAPVFHGSTLHQDTSFHNAVFPLDDVKKQPEGESALRAYRTLKNYFSKFDALREEQRFFRYELIEETALQTGVKKWLYQAYRFISDYGHSVIRPLFWLIVVPALFVLCAGLIFCCMQGWHISWTNIDYKHTKVFVSTLVSGALPFLGNVPVNENIAEALYGGVGSIVMYAFGILQKICAIIGWFLVGLAIRNRFKMK